MINDIKLFSSSLIKRPNKLECLSLASFSQSSLMFVLPWWATFLVLPSMVLLANIRPVANVIRLFTAVSYDFL